MKLEDVAGKAQHVQVDQRKYHKPIVCVRDGRLNNYGPPQMVATTQAALRSFSDSFRREESFEAKHPEDFELFQVGWYDEESGSLIPVGRPIPLARGVDFVPVQRVDSVK